MIDVTQTLRSEMVYFAFGAMTVNDGSEFRVPK